MTWMPGMNSTSKMTGLTKMTGMTGMTRTNWDDRDD